MRSKSRPFWIRSCTWVAVRHASDVLLDDGSLVQLLRDVVAGGPDQFYPTLERRMVGLGAGKGGKKGVVDVDDSFRRRATNCGDKTCM